jgi:GT2 family glycosyltransferase
MYLRGADDYTSSDLCLRLLEAGLQNWYLPEAELYHLEGQSYTPELRLPANRFNVWLHTRRWRERIEELMQRDEFRLDPSADRHVAEGSR